MNVQSRHVYGAGFNLTEAELRKLLDVVRDQFAKLAPDKKLRTYITVAYASGAKAESQDIEEILGQENYGSTRIVDLRIKTGIAEETATPSVVLRFADMLESHLESPVPLSTFVEADSRDWVLVTTAALDERLHKIQLPRLQRWFQSIPPPIYAVLGGALWIFAMFTHNDISRWDFPETRPELSDPAKYSVSEALEAGVKEGKITDPITALILLERLRVDKNEARTQAFSKATAEWDIRREKWAEQHKSFPLMLYLLVVTATPIALLFSLTRFVRYFYPAYNFCWGDYAEYLKKRHTRGNFILIVIVIGIVVSFVGGILANMLPRG